MLDMQGGYVMDFSDSTFGEFFDPHNVDIHGRTYQSYGTSKAKKMRAFWVTESDDLVGRVLSDLLDHYEADCALGTRENNPVLLTKCRAIVGRLLGDSPGKPPLSPETFLNKEFEIPNVQKLPVAFAVSEIITRRLNEVQSCLAVEAHLAVIFHCGSILEGVLLGAAQKEPEKFNRSRSSPKRNGKTKAFQDWSLSDFINVAYDVDLLKPDVQKFSHGLREFRNYIHPYHQMASGFTPDEHTAKVCLQVLKAALADLAGER